MTKAATTLNSSPVSLAAGSYDYDALKKGLDTAAKADDDARDEAVAEALKAGNTSIHDPVDPRAETGFREKAVSNKELGITETLLVFDPRQAEKAEAVVSGAIPEADLRTTQAETAAAAADKTKG